MFVVVLRCLVVVIPSLLLSCLIVDDAFGIISRIVWMVCELIIIWVIFYCLLFQTQPQLYRYVVPFSTPPLSCRFYYYSFILFYFIFCFFSVIDFVIKCNLYLLKWPVSVLACFLYGSGFVILVNNEMKNEEWGIK